MAFLLCQSVGQLLSNATKCCTVPCRSCCHGFSQVLCSPFMPYMVVTIALNLPPAIWGSKSVVSGCDSTWLAVNAVAAALHIVAAFYIVHKIQNDQDDEAATVAYDGAAPGGGEDETADVKATTASDNKMSVEEGTVYKSMEGPSGSIQFFSHWRTVTGTEGLGEANSIQRLGQVMCYDAGVAVYIVVFFAWMVWQSIGMSQVLFDGDNGDEDDVCDEMNKHMVFAIICGFLYLLLVCFAFGCSVLCLR